MNLKKNNEKAHEARTAIERLYVEMRHIFNSGAYQPCGISGNVLREALLTLNPEIYGSITDSQKVELEGLVYVIDRLPKGIEECLYIQMTSKEGLVESNFEVIIPPKRRRKCYRIDESQMFIEVTRGRSEVYDILTHLTFLFAEAEKIKKRAFDSEGHKTRAWLKLEEIITGNWKVDDTNRSIALAHLSTILGRTFEEVKNAFYRLDENKNHNNGLFHIVYHLGKITAGEDFEGLRREISFTPTLQERIGRHIYGENWAICIKSELKKRELFKRPLHIISANLHSVLNSLFAFPALRDSFEDKKSILELASLLSQDDNDLHLDKVKKYARLNGLSELEDNGGTNIRVQIFDTAQINLEDLSPEIKYKKSYLDKEKPVLIVMDYAFGEQAYETMDELLKPLESEDKEEKLRVVSISIMGKAGILEGGKGDIMLPNAHVFEGTADNYPLKNEFSKKDFIEADCQVFEGTMITVLGTSLQNKDVLEYFKDSSWKAIGLEMEGAHYQKAIQAEAKIRQNISEKVKLRYAYYASDNPLITGSTLASGSLGTAGVKPTYLITLQILNQIFS